MSSDLSDFWMLKTPYPELQLSRAEQLWPRCLFLPFAVCSSLCDCIQIIWLHCLLSPLSHSLQTRLPQSPVQLLLQLLTLQLLLLPPLQLQLPLLPLLKWISLEVSLVALSALHPACKVDEAILSSALVTRLPA